MTDEFLSAISRLLKGAKAGNPWKAKDGKFTSETDDEDSIPHHFTGQDKGRFNSYIKPGWKKLQYIDANVTFSYDKKKKQWMLGDKPASAADAALLKAAKTPPGWERVQLNADPNGACLVIGYDSKDRRQYRFSNEHNGKAAAEKFDRLREFIGVLPAIRKQVERDLDSDDERTKELATIVHLVDKTAFRVGSENDTKGDVQAYGASTLLAKHVKISGDTITFSFTGKKGVDIEKSVTSPSLAKALRVQLKGLKANDKLFEVTDKHVRTYLKKISGDDFLVKDFRTMHGTAMAMKLLSGAKMPANDKELKKLMKSVAKGVSDHLGNTPSVALSAYIDPAVWKKFTPKKG